MATSYSDADRLTSSEWTNRTIMDDLMQQKTLLMAVGLTLLGVLFLWSRRPAPQEQAARRLVRHWRDVDDPDDARDLLADNLPPILQPAMLMALHELRRQVHRGFRTMEREIERR